MSDRENGEKDGFLRGWSRRKIEAKRSEVARDVPETAVLPVEGLTEAASEAEIPDPDLLAALPSLDAITAGFDIKPFLAKGIPADLKNAALRRLWSVSPSVSQYSDPAVDYAWDWNAPGGVPGGGGLLSEQSVAKMVKDLIGSRPAPEEASGTPDGPGADPADLPGEAPPHDPLMQEKPVSVRFDRRDAQARVSAPEAVVEQALHDRPLKQDSPPAAGPRHGGALPE